MKRPDWWLVELKQVVAILGYHRVVELQNLHML